MAKNETTVEAARRAVRVSSPGKVLFPDHGWTKLDVVEHFDSGPLTDERILRVFVLSFTGLTGAIQFGLAGFLAGLMEIAQRPGLPTPGAVSEGVREGHAPGETPDTL